jgi:hypothetical protein
MLLDNARQHEPLWIFKHAVTILLREYRSCAYSWSQKIAHLSNPWAADRAASIPAGSQLDHAFPAPDGSRGSPKDTSLVDFVFVRTTRESVGHGRTRQRHGSGP